MLGSRPGQGPRGVQEFSGVEEWSVAQAGDRQGKGMNTHAEPSQQTGVSRAWSLAEGQGQGPEVLSTD